MKLFVTMVGIFIVAGMLIGILVGTNPEGLRTEYATSISVETPDKIETAISNVVSDLEKRDFVPVNLEVTWYPAIKTYVIHASGIDRTKLGKYEP